MGDITPRLLSVEEAARYVGLSRSAFLGSVANSVPPLRLGTRRVTWDRVALDRWIDAQSGISTPDTQKETNPLDALL
mgnify:CR=1 FL=1